MSPYTKISWSSLKVWMDCKKKHHYKYIKWVKVPVDHRYIAVGAVAHDLVEEWLTKHDRKPGFIIENVAEMYDRYIIGRWINTKNKTKAEVRDEAIANVSKVEAMFLEEPELRQDFKLEQPFDTPFPTRDGWVMHGYMDYVGADGSIFDMKLSTSMDYVYKQRKQLLFYDVNYALTYGTLPTQTAFLLPLQSERIVKHTWSSEDRSMILNMAREFIDSIRTGGSDEGVYTNDICYWCDYKKLCLTPEMESKILGGKVRFA